jgi:ABC-type polysaccharide/polyol phosphate export permease
LRSRLREAYFIGLFDSLPLLRDPMILVLLSMISFLPVLFIFVFTGAGSTTYQAVVGAIVLSLAFTGLFSSQSVYFNKHWFRFQDILVADGVSPLAYAVGLSLATFIVSIPALVVAVALLFVWVHPDVVGVLLGALASIALWISMVLTGFAIGASTKNVRRANSLPQVLSFFLGFIPPVYYTLDRLPAEVQPFALLAPTTHAAQLAKYYVGLVDLTGTDIAIGWAYLVVFAGAMAFLAIRKAHWTDP